MWFKEYRDYPIDKPLIQEEVEPSHGIIGCEMHDLNGWGTYLHQFKPRKKSLWAKLMLYLFANSSKDKNHGSS